MEDDYRPFEAVKIGLASAETGQERFTRDGGVYAPPPLSYWRCNLTALSQRFNLYFAASRDAIAVYRPDFPFQKLYRLPALVIPPALANPTARGYIDEQVPHAINHLTVGDLGKEEILLLATDSGNITAYYTKTIEEAIRKDPYRFSTDARSDYVGVRPFFTHWVDESAWGLAIHTNARMIAVSANTPHHVPSDDPCAKITVFAFALTDDSDDRRAAEEPDAEGEAYLNEGANEPDWEEWVAMGVAATTPARKRNYKITLAGVEGHDHNIPCISFVNTDDDLNGDWLLSTDIGGNLKIWQIWQGICQKSWDFAERRPGPAFLRRREGGWSVAALDPRSFRSAKTMEQFCGHYDGHNLLESYDLTAVVRFRTPGNSHVHPQMRESTEDENDLDDEIETHDSWSNLDEAAVDIDQGQHGLDLSNDHVRDACEGSSGHQSGTYRDPEQISESEMIAYDSRSPEPDAGRVNNAGTSAGPAIDTPAVEDVILDDDDDLDPDEDGSGYHSDSEQQLEGDDRSSVSRRSTTSLSSLANPSSPEVDVHVLSASDTDSPPRARHHDETKSQPPAFTMNDSSVVRARGTASAPNIPTLYCGASHLRLLMTPQADSPHVFCANILKQALPPAIERSNHAFIDRLNMVLQLPELGVVVVATQIGRCAVCSLTKRTNAGTLGLRVDWILPTEKQERKGLRPLGPLLGIAASPVQGHFKSETSAASQGSDETDSWGKDGIVDGVPTTFDPTVLVVEEQNGRGERSEVDDGQSGNRHKMKRKRGSRDPSRMQHHTTKTEFRKWEVPTGAEPWQAMDSSRRYRLMLTYLDMTVLTYELSRGIEGDDIAQDGPISTLELLD
jgi:hypothetical protein